MEVKDNVFEILPNEIIIDIALNMSLNTIVNLCQTSQKFRDLIYDNEYFWQQKFYQDYGNPNFEANSWKELYINYMNVWVWYKS